MKLIPVHTLQVLYSSCITFVIFHMSLDLCLICAFIFIGCFRRDNLLDLLLSSDRIPLDLFLDPHAHTYIHL